MQKNNKLKILVLGYLPPPQEGTAKITEIIVNSEYLKNRFIIKFLSLRKRNTPSERGKVAVKNIFFNLVNFLNYLYLIVKFRPNMIYQPLAQNKFGFLRDSIFILLGKLFGKKTCVHFHGGNFDLFYKQQSKNFQKYISWALKKTNRLILLAEKFKKQFSSFMDVKKMCVIYNCVPEIPNMTKKNEKFPTENKTFKILFIGYLSKAKGALDLVKSIPIVISEYKKPIEFILCGQPIDIERNITFIPEPHFGYSGIVGLITEKTLQEYIRIYRNLPLEEKDKLFSEADIFVFPSYSEGLPVVILEAMDYSLPIITTPVGALDEILKEGVNCYFVQPGDYENLAKKILILAENKNLRIEMGKKNRELILNKFKADIFSENLGHIWKFIV